MKIFFLLLISLVAGASDNSRLTLRLGLNAEFETLHPLFNTMVAGLFILDASNRPLVALNPQGEAYSVLLSRLPTFENKSVRKTQQGGLEVEIDILPQAIWGDGVPLTCDDVKLAWEIGSSPTSSTANHRDFLNISSIESAPDKPKHCLIRFQESRWNFYLYLPRPVPSHLEAPIFAKYKSEPLAYEKQTLYVRDPGNPGLYNGPFRVTNHRLGQDIVLVRNEHWWGITPYFEKLIFKFILNSSAMMAQLLSGELDMTTSSGLSFDQALVLEKKIKSEKLALRQEFVESPTFAHLDVNLDNSVLKELPVRQALLLAWDREQMNKAFFAGRQKPAHSFAFPMDEWFTENPRKIKIYSYDLALAKKTLENAGWRQTASGIREKEGRRLSIVLSGVVDQKLSEVIEVYLQNAWKKIGVELRLKTYPARVFFGEILRRRDFQMAFYSWVSLPNSVPVSSLSADEIPSSANSWSGNNRTGWRNPEATRLLAEAPFEFDKLKRIEQMQKVLKLSTEELPVLPGFYKLNSSAIPKELLGFEPSGHLYTELLKVENWKYAKSGSN